MANIHLRLLSRCIQHLHHSDVIMSAMASQITGVSIIYSTICSGTYQRKYQSSASLAFLRGIHRSQRASNAENVSIRWRHQVSILQCISPYYCITRSDCTCDTWTFLNMHGPIAWFDNYIFIRILCIRVHTQLKDLKDQVKRRNYRVHCWSFPRRYHLLYNDQFREIPSSVVSPEVESSQWQIHKQISK